MSRPPIPGSGSPGHSLPVLPFPRAPPPVMPGPSTHLLLLVDHVVDEQDAVASPVVPRELLQGHPDVHPLVGLPVTPPLQGPRLHPHRLRHKPRGSWGQSQAVPSPPPRDTVRVLSAPMLYPGRKPQAGTVYTQQPVGSERLLPVLDGKQAWGESGPCPTSQRESAARPAGVRGPTLSHR